MSRSFTLLCEVLAHLRKSNPGLLDGVRIELYGTMRRDNAPKHLADVARSHGLDDLVHEDPRWVSYRKSIEILTGGDAALVLGVDDAGYMPSKLFSYAMSGRPLLAVLRKDGSALAEFQRIPELGHAIWFDDTGEMPTSAAGEEVSRFLEEAADRVQFDRRDVLKPFLAPNMARRHVDLFESCLQ